MTPIERSAGGGGGGLTSPLTTKGDIWGWSTANDRIPVGSDAQVLTADSTQALGVKWSAAATGGLVKLFDQTLSVSASSIDTGANGIAGGHADLLIWAMTRTDEAVERSGINLNLNNDSGANYARGFMATSAVSTTPIAGMAVGETAMFGITAGSSASASTPGVLRMTIPSYDQTTFFKVAEWQTSVVDAATASNANREFDYQQSVWKSTSAITRLAISATTAGKNLVAGSRLVIYGAQ